MLYKEPLEPKIIVGRKYRYLSNLPSGCKDGVYEIVHIITDIPTHQEKALLFGLSGIDKGKWHTVTFRFIAQCFELLPKGYQEEDSPPEKRGTLMPYSHRTSPVVASQERVIAFTVEGMEGRC